MRPDPKPPKRHRASSDEWTEIRSHFMPHEPCWICGGPWESLHHIYPRSQGGDDVTVNLVPVCGSGTTGCHGKLEARDAKASFRLRVMVTADPARLAYLKFKLGDGMEAWLDRRYPRPPHIVWRDDQVALLG